MDNEKRKEAKEARDHNLKVGNQWLNKFIAERTALIFMLGLNETGGLKICAVEELSTPQLTAYLSSVINSIDPQQAWHKCADKLPECIEDRDYSGPILLCSDQGRVFESIYRQAGHTRSSGLIMLGKGGFDNLLEGERPVIWRYMPACPLPQHELNKNAMQ